MDLLTLRPLASQESRYVHVFHQSSLNTFLTCPELGRKTFRNDMPRDETEAAAKGTAVHAAIESVLTDLVLPDEALSLAFKTFRDIAEHGNFRYVKVKTESTCLNHIEGAFASWWDYVYPQLRSALWIEERFTFPFYEDDERVIYLRGTADYAERLRIDDWKVTQNKDKYSESFGGDGWEQKRWSIQATTYCAAYYNAFNAIPEFRYVALDVHGREPQLLTVERNLGHFDFLADQCVTIAQQLERGNDYRYALNDQHALCSAKWCQNWYECKGRFLQ